MSRHLGLLLISLVSFRGTHKVPSPQEVVSLTFFNNGLSVLKHLLNGALGPHPLFPELLRGGPFAIHRYLESEAIIHSLLYLGAHYREACCGVGRVKLLESGFDQLLTALHLLLVLLLLIQVVLETLKEIVHQSVAKDALHQLQVFLVPDRLVHRLLFLLLLRRIIAGAEAGDLLTLLDHVGEASLLDNEIEETLPLP